MNVAMNKKGYTSIDEVMKTGMQGLDPEAFEVAAETTGAVVLDTRNAADFATGFVPRSVNIGLDGQFAPWVGAMIVDVKQPILLVTDEGKEEETLTRLTRVGFDAVIGHLNGGIASWIQSGKEIDTVDRISAETFKNEANIGESYIVDVRKESEYRAEHVEEAYNKPLDFINEWFLDLSNHDGTFYIHCAGGYRSMIAASILKSKGIHNFKEVDGGFKAIAEAGVAKTDFVCQSKLQKA
jgi:rhodanese-related sulfurtransferase